MAPARVFPDNRPYPVRSDPVRHRVPEEAAWSGTLREGDVLYVPRGWWHAAFPMDEPSLHLTVGLWNRTGLDYLQWLGNRLTASELFRQDLPRFAEPEARREHFARLQRELLSAWGPDVDAEYFRSLDADRELQMEPYLPWRAMQDPLPEGDDFVVRLNARRPAEVTDRSDDGRRSVCLTAGGKTWRFAPAARGLLDTLLQREPATLAGLCAAVRGAMSREQVRLLLAKLLVDGVVSVRCPSPSSPSEE